TATIVATPTVVATPTPPAPPVVISDPSAGEIVSGSTTFAVVRQSTGVSWVNFYVDGNYLASSPPFSITWDTKTVADGAHSLSVKAYDNSGAMIANPVVSVSVKNAVVSATATATPTRTATPQPTTGTQPGSVNDSLRPTNDIPNGRIPTAAELSTFRSG